MGSLVILANSLILGYTLYYAIKYLISNLTFCQIESPYQFVFKLIIFTIIVNSSYFVCEQFLFINNLISESIREIGKNLLNTDISFSNLISKLNSIITIEESSFSIFTIDGLIKSFISIGLFNLLFSNSLRYIMLKVFVLICPFAFLSLVNASSSWFFKTWFKSFLSLLLLQSFTSLILIVTFSINFSQNSIMSKCLYVGSIYALIKSNSYIMELIGGISTDISSGISNLSNLIKTK